MDIEAVKSFALRPVEHRYTVKDTMLYALALGYGEDPTDPLQLQYVYEKGLCAVPSICVVLSHPGFWMTEPSLKMDCLKLLHGEQAFTIEKPIPPEGVVRGEYEILGVEDRGPEKGAVMYMAKRLFDQTTGDLLATVTSVYMLRGDGGSGGFGIALPQPDPLPETTPDVIVETRSLPQMALIYRLSGDYNPIHADPAIAAKAGFPQPILHGLCSLGLATRALIDAVGHGNAAQLRSLSLRFSKPVFPGETIRTEIFRTNEGARFRARAIERDVVVLDRGTAVFG